MPITDAPAPMATGTRPVDRLLDAICRGTGVPTDAYTDDAVLDATVPGWRFSVRGGEGIARQYRGWYAHPAVMEELERHPIEDGEVVRYLLTWTERGVPHAAHHCHLLRLAADGRIASDTVFCGGRWDAGLLAEMAVASDAR
jgi:hypothetical protein